MFRRHWVRPFLCAISMKSFYKKLHDDILWCRDVPTVRCLRLGQKLLARVLHSMILYVPSLTGVAGLEKTETGSCVGLDMSAACYIVSNFHFAPPCLWPQWTSQHTPTVRNLKWIYQLYQTTRNFVIYTCHLVLSIVRVGNKLYIQNLDGETYRLTATSKIAMVG
jgi:hypothetical protein